MRERFGSLTRFERAYNNCTSLLPLLPVIQTDMESDMRILSTREYSGGGSGAFQPRQPHKLWNEPPTNDPHRMLCTNYYLVIKRSQLPTVITRKYGPEERTRTALVGSTILCLNQLDYLRIISIRIKKIMIVYTIPN